VSTTLLVPLSLVLRADEKATPPFLEASNLTWLIDTLPSLVSVPTSCCCLLPATVVGPVGVATSWSDGSSSSRLFRKTFLRLDALNIGPSFASAMVCEERVSPTLRQTAQIIERSRMTASKRSVGKADQGADNYLARRKTLPLEPNTTSIQSIQLGSRATWVPDTNSTAFR
jgi:hypothetical protein